MAPDNPDVAGALARALVAAGEIDGSAKRSSPRCRPRAPSKPAITRARAALELASAAPAADTAAIEARIAANPDDHRSALRAGRSARPPPATATAPPTRCSRSSPATATGTTARRASASSSCSRRRASRTRGRAASGGGCRR